MRAGLLAYRQWALEHRVDFELIFGNPIPGYHAPAELTLPAARRNMETFVGITSRALHTGTAHPRPEFSDVPPALHATFGQRSPHLTALYIAMHGWARIHGLIMLELFEHSTPVVGDAETFYHHEIEMLLRDAGLG
jgi:hypothetical protein